MKQLKLFGICLGKYTQKRIVYDDITDDLFITFYNFTIDDSILYGKINTENIMFMATTRLSEDEIERLKKQIKEDNDKNNNKVILIKENEVIHRYNHINENEFFIDETIREILVANKDKKLCLEVHLKGLNEDIILSLIDNKTKQYLCKSRLEIFAKSLNVYFE